MGGTGLAWAFQEGQLRLRGVSPEHTGREGPESQAPDIWSLSKEVWQRSASPLGIQVRGCAPAYGEEAGHSGRSTTSEGLCQNPESKARANPDHVFEC